MGTHTNTNELQKHYAKKKEIRHKRLCIAGFPFYDIYRKSKHLVTTHAEQRWPWEGADYRKGQKNFRAEGDGSGCC